MEPDELTSELLSVGTRLFDLSGGGGAPLWINPNHVVAVTKSPTGSIVWTVSRTFDTPLDNEEVVDILIGD
jgi:hypothetical protein